MTSNLFDRMKETARWSALKERINQPLRDEVDEAIKIAKLVDWQKFHKAMDLLEMSDKWTVETLLKEAIKG